MHNDDAPKPLTARQKQVRVLIEEACETVDPNYLEEIDNTTLNQLTKQIERTILLPVQQAWRSLGIRGAASAGTRTGLIGPFVDEVPDGETMQVDRDAYREFTGGLNGDSL